VFLCGQRVVQEAEEIAQVYYLAMLPPAFKERPPRVTPTREDWSYRARSGFLERSKTE
jgi:hypothetical protein